MAVRRGFEPRMQLLTAYSLSRGAPSASRPPHHTRSYRAVLLNLFLLIGTAWRTYYFLGLISQTYFFTDAFDCAFTRQYGYLKSKKSDLSATIGLFTEKKWRQARRETEKENRGNGEKQAKTGSASPLWRGAGSVSNSFAEFFRPECADRSLRDEPKLL